MRAILTSRRNRRYRASLLTFSMFAFNTRTQVQINQDRNAALNQR